MKNTRTLERHLTPLGAWAFSIGTSVGWGSLVVTASTYLVQAGPAGSVLGLAVGAVIMLLMAWNYAYMMQRVPESGGAYAFTREAFGYDQAFLAAWFLALDKFVWREAAGRIRDWKARFGAVPSVSVNVSRVDMLSPDIRGVFAALLEEFGLTAAELTLEIAEPAFSGDFAPVVAAAQTLRDMGFAIEMDDFGTGSTGLGALTRLPVDALKMDVSVIRAAFDGAGDMRSVRLIVDIARRLGVPAAAEGVETDEQYRALKEMGCRLMQGDHFSKPVPPEEFVERFLGA